MLKRFDMQQKFRIFETPQTIESASSHNRPGADPVFEIYIHIFFL